MGEDNKIINSKDIIVVGGRNVENGVEIFLGNGETIFISYEEILEAYEKNNDKSE